MVLHCGWACWVWLCDETIEQVAEQVGPAIVAQSEKIQCQYRAGSGLCLGVDRAHGLKMH